MRRFIRTPLPTKAKNLEAITCDQFVGVRLYLRLSQQELANILQANRATVSRWENGKAKFPRSVSLAMRYLEKFCPPIEKPNVQVPKKRKEGPRESQKEQDPKVVRFHADQS